MNRRFILIFLMLIVFTSNALAQYRTYYYVPKEKYVDDVKEKLPAGATSEYYTFHGNICYQSDANGNSLGGVVYQCQSEKNGNLWYVERVQIAHPSFFMLITKDLSVMNKIIRISGTPTITIVSYRADPPKKSDGIPDMRH